MSQNFEIFVPTLKHNRLLAIAQAIAMEKEKAEDNEKLQTANKEIVEYFAKHRYWWVNNGKMIFDSKHGNLWQAESDGSTYRPQEALAYAERLKLAKLQWNLPTPQQVKEVLEDKQFPLITAITSSGLQVLFQNVIATTQQTLMLNNSWSLIGSGGLCLCTYHNPIFLNSVDTLNYFISKKWHIRPCDVFPANNDIKKFIEQREIPKSTNSSNSALFGNFGGIARSINIATRENINLKNTTNLTWETFSYNEYYLKRNPYALDKQDNALQFFLLNFMDSDLQNFYENLETLVELSKKTYQADTTNVKISEIWQDIDYITTRLPKIDTLQFSDVEQGIWEFYAPPALQKNRTKITSNEFVRPRNPVTDIREAIVAIDFGTSSTVVAIRENGKDELLRIGMQAKDFTKDAITDDQYENPTVLEFLNIQNFLQDWHSETYRPLVDWNNIHCSHEARAKLRNNNSNTKVVGSILLRLKQWALRNQQNAQVRLKDQQGFEYQLAPLAEKNPVKGQPLDLTKDYPELDPIEIYAWFLGMNINWRNRGVFLQYVLTFPVDYSNEVKAKILASFRRGIQRSLPEAIVYDECFNDFSVTELQSEPAAFAAAALKRLKIKADEKGTAYAVFDFGGGTTDFDYGIYRTPTTEEEDEGWDEVLEHFGSSGDKFLGGENLLENMAYLVFQSNSGECRKQGITFTQPIDAERFAGSETLIAQTQSAYTNTTLMMAKLRPLWENGKIDTDATGVEKFKLLNKEGVAVDCEISIKQDMLIGFLQERIRNGLIGFFTALKTAFEQHLHQLPDTIHILLAGNSSRSRIVLGFLGCIEDKPSQEMKAIFQNDLEILFDDKIPKFEIHQPLNADPKNPYTATAKTGVALGLLRVAGGEYLKVINHASQANTDSPFQFFVGRFRQDFLNVALHRGQAYDEWVELGKPLNGIFTMGYTQLPKASVAGSIERGESGVYEKKINLSGNLAGQKVFARIIAPAKIEICTANSLEEITQNNFSNVRQLELN